MEIRNITSSMPMSGAARPAVDNVPILLSAQGGGQVTEAAVKAPSESESAHPGGNNSREAMASIAESLQSLSKASGLEFSIDDELGRVIVKVMDPETREVLKQFPSEDAVALAKSLSQLNGNLVKEKA